MKAYKMEKFIEKKDLSSFETKFGGQPDWIDKAEWPVSAAWDNRPMKFVGQIRLDKIFEDLDEMVMAYIFLTQPENREDSFYDPDIIFPNGGENAVIIQPNGKLAEFIGVEEHCKGPSVSERIWIPQTSEVEETSAMKYEEIDIDKVGGIPALFQNDTIGDNERLVLQLHTNWLPFYINAGCAPTMYVVLKESNQEGYLFIEDM